MNQFMFIFLLMIILFFTEAVKAQEKIETEKWFEDYDAEEESSDDENQDEDGEDEDDKDMELFYFTTALDARLCSVKKESCCSTSQLDLASTKKYNKGQIFVSNIIKISGIWEQPNLAQDLVTRRH